jgi:hypothetical protein
VTEPADPSDFEARFERELARDRELLRFLNRATLWFSLFTVAVLLTLAIAMGRNSIWLATIPFYSVGTRLCVFVARYAIGLPLFLLELDSPQPAVREAAQRVFERNRAEIGTAMLTHANERPTPQQIGELRAEDAAAIARSRDLPSRRRTGLAVAIVWAAVSIVVWGLLIATGGGPTGLTTRS